ncbi:MULTISPECIES: aldehyde ferredoxin oxidoreductase family protein [Haloferax]|uniref:Aldehyde ferredoxin oxidoreductase n=1 Tax=Haloferax marinum TaxID=2666143 RepID=A0A6A8GCF9_9EURY|nr:MULTISPECIES: aldehyde ferredoxin oxidoreductase family protein [Haloferax]KAB1190697.1 aldehyde ferredoxin oxidoreductase family protein [Haloferax sp. CBA1150]MRW98228.1 aldehyde ferredoxin oxidoreductase [Haloferax marinum]
MSQRVVQTDEVQELTHLLRVNLTERTVQTETVPQEYRDRFIAGKGLGTALLLDELEPGTDPLSPENLLIFSFGPLTGFAPGTSRYGAITKSPLTGTFVDSYSGGHFPTRFRWALPSYLGMIVEGKADSPVYLDVSREDVTIEDASHLWGMKTDETAKQFDGKETKTAAIGPAGENLVRYATISSDEGTHHAGRGGVGAVMGSKNLKAVVASADGPPKSDIQELRIKHTQRLGTDKEVAWARDGGTQLIPDWTQEIGALPTHNWTKGTVADVEDINIDAFSVGHQTTDSCYGCPVACGHVVDFSDADVEDAAFPDAQVDWGPEYETIGMMGSNTDITDVTGITELAHRADTLGMDTISLGNVISFAMECVDAGLVDYDLSWGDARAAAQLIEDIAHRDNEVGDMLAEGTKLAAEELDDDTAREAAVQVKGMELPAYDPRASFGMALAYATSDRGGCHQRAWPIGSDAMGGSRDPFGTDGMAEAVIEDQDENALTFSMVSCDFTAYNYERAAEWLNELGYDVDVEDLETVGERTWTMTRLFNVREGFGRDEDELPVRFTEPLEAGGPADGNHITEEAFATMLDEYYEKRGYTSDGVPTDELLDRLDIQDFAEAAH